MSRWTFCGSVCAVLTLFNILGIRHTTPAIPIGTTTNITMMTLPHPSMVAAVVVNDTLDSNNFRIDPRWMHQQQEQQSQQTHTSLSSFWQLLEHHSRIWPNETQEETLYYYATERNVVRTPTTMCPTNDNEIGMEGPGGHAMLTTKIKIATAARPRGTFPPWPSQDEPEDHPHLRLLCAIYTHSPMFYLARTAALTWGRHCDGFVAFSNITIPSLHMIDLRHAGPESYHNMWQKTRSLWSYIYKHYRDEYDLFHLGGDDMYVIPENLKLRYTQVLQVQTASFTTSSSSSFNMTTTTTNEEMKESSSMTSRPIFMGQWVPHGPNQKFVGGGGGYTLNQPALKVLVEQALPRCHVNTTASFEDRLITKCLRQVGIEASDTRDRETGEQTYHDTNPNNLYLTVPVPPESPQRRRASFHAKAAAFWETLPHPSQPNRTVGPRNGLQSAAEYSVSFHKIHNPEYMVRLHILLRPELCSLPIRKQDF